MPFGASGHGVRGWAVGGPTDCPRAFRRLRGVLRMAAYLSSTAFSNVRSESRGALASAVGRPLGRLPQGMASPCRNAVPLSLQTQSLFTGGVFGRVLCFWVRAWHLSFVPWGGAWEGVFAGAGAKPSASLARKSRRRASYIWQRFVDREVLRWDGARGRNDRGGTLAYPRASGGDMVN